MGKKLTTGEFIEKAKNIHGDKYDYSLVEYINTHTKIKIICKEHGVFEQAPSKHLTGQGCRICSLNIKTTKNVINELKQYHGDEYDYSNVKYIDTKTPVEIICHIHGSFFKRYSRLNTKCKKCTYDSYKISQQTFIENATEIHDHKYDYSLVEYINANTKVKIICTEHGVFEQLPNNHIHKKYGCPTCGGRNITTNDIIERANKTHNNFYSYEKTSYTKMQNKILITCPIHGNFKQNTLHHLNGNGCPICKNSLGEMKIRDLLIENNISFEQEKRFIDCRNKYPLPFDFYLLEKNMIIEYDGKQHFEIVNYFGGEDGLKQRQKHDKIKNQYCLDNNIDLIRIRYDEDISHKLTNLLRNNDKQNIDY